MAVSRALRRLLRVRNMEEEQSRNALETGLGDLHQLEHAQATAGERGRSARRLVTASAQSGELLDRLAGLAEEQAAILRSALLAPRIVETAQTVAELRQEFLEKRIERRQAETMVQESEAHAALEADRHVQQASDAWYLNQRARAEAAGTEDEATLNRPAVETS